MAGVGVTISRQSFWSTGGRYPPVAHGSHNVQFEHVVQGQPPLQPCVNHVQGTKRPQGGEKIMWPNVDASLDLGHGGCKVRKGIDVVIHAQFLPCNVFRLAQGTCYVAGVVDPCTTEGYRPSGPD